MQGPHGKKCNLITTAHKKGGARFPTLQDTCCENSGEICRKIVEKMAVYHLSFHIISPSDLENNNTAYVAYPSLIVLHPDYINLFNRENDIALVQLREPLPESVEILPLGGPPELETPGLDVRVLGWGRSTSDPIFPEDTNLLQEGEVNLVSNDFANQEAYYDGRVTDSMIVAGKLDPYVSTFRGDSGGPLLSFNSETNNWEQIGVNSWGAGCSKPDNPFSVYTRVSSHRDWIDSIIQQDFFHWSYQNENPSEEEDGDPYSLLTEFIFDLDPKEDDSPAWTATSAFDTNGPIQAIFTPIIHRSSVPKLGFSYEFSSDLDSWEDLQLDWSSINTRPGMVPYTSEYLLPLATSQDNPGFYRLRHDNATGILRGPTPIRIGTTTYGIFNLDSDNEGPSRFDFVLEHLGSDHPAQIQIESDRNDPIRLQLIELETDFVIYDDIRIATPDEPLYVSVTIGGGKTVAVRVESTQTEFEQAFEMYTGLFRNVTASSPGTRIQGQITFDDSSYRRQDHYSTAHAYSLAADTTYLVEMESTELDSVFYLRDREKVRSLQEIDNEDPGLPERHLFRSEESLDLEIVASSWFRGDTGAYELEVSSYAEPSSLRPEDDLLAIIDTSDETDEQNGTLFYLHRLPIMNLSSQNEYEVYVSGRDGFIPQFGVLNLTEKKTEYFEIARCHQRSFKFQPLDETDYLVLVVTTERELGEVFEIRVSATNESGADLQSDAKSNKLAELSWSEPIKHELYSRESLENYLERLTNN